MKVIPLPNYIICELITDTDQTVKENGVIFKKEELPLYRVVDISKLTLNINIRIGDIIIINSVPTKVHIDDKYYYLINQEHIAGFVID